MERLAVVGGGVAGIVAAYLLQSKYEVDVFESGTRLGGHTNTFEVPDGPDAGTAVDTGFIVFNGDTYPLFQKFLGQLGVAWQRSDMSFGYYCERSGWAYGGHDLNTFFARRHLLFNPDFLRFACDIARFNAHCLRQLARGRISGSLGDFLRGYSASFVRHYVMPLGAAIWSAPLHDILSFPAETYVRFFANHGLLRVTRRPDWFTVRGGSYRYIEAFLRSFSGRIYLNSPVEKVWRRDSGVELRVAGESRSYDALVIASHADQALKLLGDPSALEQRALGSWRYLNNRTVLHRDVQVLPPHRRVWASWNYRRSLERLDRPTLTYDMNRLQNLKTEHHYLVTLNPVQPIACDQILGEWQYRHPQYDERALESQSLLPQLNQSRMAFCGSYHRYGFHEDAILSAVAAAESLGQSW
jgi:predicted NAD/FAD-binding protein